MEKEIKFYFVYSDNDEYKYKLDLLYEVFGEGGIYEIRDDFNEKIVSVFIENLNSEHLIELINSFEDNLKILYIADSLILGTNSDIEDIGL